VFLTKALATLVLSERKEGDGYDSVSMLRLCYGHGPAREEESWEKKRVWREEIHEKSEADGYFLGFRSRGGGSFHRVGVTGGWTPGPGEKGQGPTRPEQLGGRGW